MNRNRIIGIFLVCLLSLNYFFVLMHFHHDHDETDGEDCITCTLTNDVEKKLKVVVLAITTTSLVIMFMIRNTYKTRHEDYNTCINTLVSMKVRMNN